MCKELDEYLKKVEKVKGLGAVTEFAGKVGVSRVNLWRYRTGKLKPSAARRKVIKRLTMNEVLPENFK